MNRRTILVIDDDALHCEALCAILRQHGAAADWSGSGEGGLVRLGATRYDAVIIDEMLSDIRGTEVLARARAAPGASVVPAVLLTALDDGELVELRAKAEALGAVRVLRKPATAQQIIETLREMLRGRQP